VSDGRNKVKPSVKGVLE